MLLYGQTRSNDYLGNYLYGILGKEMFVNCNATMGNIIMGSDAYLLNAAGLAQQWHDNGKLYGTFTWLWIRISSGLQDTGDNKEDVQMILDGMERWYRDYDK